jgi:enediyne biosynthesis protein E4
VSAREPLFWLSFLAGVAAVAATSSSQPAVTAPVFVDRAAALGVDFVHFNGMSGQTYMVEILGAGAALLDYDNDGDLDLYLVQGGMLGPGKTLKDALHPPADARPLTDRLYRNDLIRDGKTTGALRFTDVTGQANLALADYGQGVATGDYDNDGWIDIYRTAFGHTRLLRNTGKGTFEDATARAGVDEARWSTAATWLDFDRDGWLDLFVADYIDYPLATVHACASEAGFVDYCGPLAYKPLTHRLFRNRGDGTFEDVAKKSGIAAAAGNGLGAVAVDVNRDGWPDLYVANDQMPNFLWINRQDGTFAEEGLLGGAAVSGEGKPQASMGVSGADFDGDGDDDLLVTNLTSEGATLYVNNGQGLFNDETPRSGLGPPSLPFTSFGTLDFDYDNDGWLDLLVVSGTVKKIEAQVKAGDPLPLKQGNQLYRNSGRGRFEDSTARAGDLAKLNVGRGAAFGDLDGDGDTDVVVTRNDGPPQVLINQLGQKNRWLGLRLVGGPRQPRDLLGARVALRLADGRVLARRARTDGSYLSASDPRVLFGLGPAGGPAPAEMQVTWPDGKTERWPASAAPEGRYTTLRQGSGQKVEAGASAAAEVSGHAVYVSHSLYVILGAEARDRPRHRDPRPLRHKDTSCGIVWYCDASRISATQAG